MSTMSPACQRTSTRSTDCRGNDVIVVVRHIPSPEDRHASRRSLRDEAEQSSYDAAARLHTRIANWALSN